MTTQERIALIRLSEKINRNPEFTERIGVCIVNERTDVKKIKVHENSEKSFG